MPDIDFSLEPLKVDLTILQGATFLWRRQWLEDDVPVDLTDIPVRGMVRRRKVSDTEPLVDFEEFVSGDEDGWVTIQVPAAVTAGFDWSGRAYWDLEVEFDDGVVRLFEGRVVLSLEVTR